MITVIRSGFLTTVQDLGRWGYQAYGMPVAGAMDRYAYRVANLLASNEPGAAVLEMTMLGGVFQFERECLIAVCGADMQASLNGSAIDNWSALIVPAGSILEFNYAVQGCRAYLAVCGGFAVPVILGSRSTYIRAAVGGLAGRALQAGDVLTVGQIETILKVEQSQKVSKGCVRKLPAEFIPCYNGSINVRVLLGPQDDLFTADGIATLFSSEYIIANEADRMGYQLEGAAIEHKGKPDIVSDALCQGAIQVPGNGRPIIMMADRQTTGGYAKIGVVISADLPWLAQTKPGDVVRFSRCSDEQAVAVLQQEAKTYEIITEILS